MLSQLPELPEPLAAELRALTDKACDLTISEEECLHLSALLRDRPDVQSYYLAYTAIHARLGWEFGPSEQRPFVAVPDGAGETAREGDSPVFAGAKTGTVPGMPSTSKGDSPVFAETRTGTVPVSGWWMVGGGGVVVAILVGCLLLLGRGGGPGGDEPQPAGPLARITAGVALEWEDPKEPAVVGQPLAAGRHRLVIGIAEVTFGNGAVAVVEAPADFEIVGPDRAVVHSGQVVVRAEDIARGFVLDTARTEIVDLGTEFGVKVNRSSETEVHVFEGSVIARSKDGGVETERHLKAGQAIRYSADGDAQPQAAASAPQRFVRRLPGEADNPARKIPLNDSRVESIRVLPAPAEVSIDGDLSEWDDRGEFRAACKPPNERSHFVAGRMMYDDEFLYIAAHVGDPAPMRNILDPRTDADKAWCGGAVQVRVSTDRAKGWPLDAEWKIHGPRDVRPKDLSGRLSHLTLWYYAPAERACLHVNYGMDLHGEVVNPPGFRGAFRRDADGRGYTAEYAIPWSLLGAPPGDRPRSGDVLATSWNVHWSNGSGRLWQGHLIDIFNPKESGWTFLRAATWGKAVYE